MGRITVTVTGTLPGDPYLYQPDSETPALCCVPLALHEIDFEPGEAYMEISGSVREALHEGFLREGDTVTFEGQLHLVASNGSPRRQRRSGLRRAVMRRLLAR